MRSRVMYIDEGTLHPFWREQDGMVVVNCCGVQGQHVSAEFSLSWAREVGATNDIRVVIERWYIRD